MYSKTTTINIQKQIVIAMNYKFQSNLAQLSKIIALRNIKISKSQITPSINKKNNNNKIYK